ncbi:MAG: hypothetical protein ACTSVL_12610 [Promethearchaeota archaeon]
MEQINFRVKSDEKKVIEFLAKKKGISIPEFAKQAVLDVISPIRIDMAFQLLKDGKIGRKQTWILSGMQYHEFMIEWAKRGAEETLPDEVFDLELSLAKEIDLSKYLQNK